MLSLTMKEVVNCNSQSTVTVTRVLWIACKSQLLIMPTLYIYSLFPTSCGFSWAKGVQWAQICPCTFGRMTGVGGGGGGTDTETGIITESSLWRREFPSCACWGLNPQTSDHESSTLPLDYTLEQFNSWRIPKYFHTRKLLITSLVLYRWTIPLKM